MERARELKASGWCRQEQGGERRSLQGKGGRRAHDATIHPRRAQQIRTSVELLVVLMVDANVCAEITLAKTTLSSCNHALVSVLD